MSNQMVVSLTRDIAPPRSRQIQRLPSIMNIVPKGNSAGQATAFPTQFSHCNPDAILETHLSLLALAQLVPRRGGQYQDILALVWVPEAVGKGIPEINTYIE